MQLDCDGSDECQDVCEATVVALEQQLGTAKEALETARERARASHSEVLLLRKQIRSYKRAEQRRMRLLKDIFGGPDYDED